MKCLPEMNGYQHEKQLWTGNFQLWQEISFVLPWHEISSCDKKFLSFTKIFLWQEISSCGKTFLPEENICLSPEDLFLLLQESICLTGTFCFILQKTLSCQICDKNTWISAKISCEPEDLVGAWLPGSLAPGEYPTLIKWLFAWPFRQYVEVNQAILSTLLSLETLKKVPGGCVLESHFSIQLKPKPSWTKKWDIQRGTFCSPR